MIIPIEPRFDTYQNREIRCAMGAINLYKPQSKEQRCVLILTISCSSRRLSPHIFLHRAYLIQPAVKDWHPSPLGCQRYQKVWLENGGVRRW